MALQIQRQPSNGKAHLASALGGRGGGQSDAFTTDLSLATPGGFSHFKSTGKHGTRQGQKRFLEENPIKSIMSRSNGNGPRLELNLKLSPTRAVGLGPDSPARSIESLSSPSSCMSSELSQDEVVPVSSMMVVVGCPRCLMYVMTPEDDTECPRCKSSVLLDVVKAAAATGAANGVGTPATACGGAKRMKKS